LKVGLTSVVSVCVATWNLKKRIESHSRHDANISRQRENLKKRIESGIRSYSETIRYLIRISKRELKAVSSCPASPGPIALESQKENWKLSEPTSPLTSLPSWISKRELKAFTPSLTPAHMLWISKRELKDFITFINSSSNPGISKRELKDVRYISSTNPSPAFTNLKKRIESVVLGAEPRHAPLGRLESQKENWKSSLMLPAPSSGPPESQKENWKFCRATSLSWSAPWPRESQKENWKLEAINEFREPPHVHESQKENWKLIIFSLPSIVQNVSESQKENWKCIQWVDQKQSP